MTTKPLTARSRAIREAAEGEKRGSSKRFKHQRNAHNEQPYLLDIADAADEKLARQGAFENTDDPLYKAIARYREWQRNQDD